MLFKPNSRVKQKFDPEKTVKWFQKIFIENQRIPRFYGISGRLGENVKNIPFSDEDKKNYKKTKEYLDNYFAEYGYLRRRMFYDIVNGFYDTFKKQSHYYTYFCNVYKIMKRTVNSLFHDVMGKIAAIKELKKVELDGLKQKIKVLEKKIASEEKTCKKLKELAIKNKLSKDEHKKYKQLKFALWKRKEKLNRLNQNRINREKALQSGRVSICFGGKKNFKKQYNLEANGYKSYEKWLNDFRKQRDSTILYLGTGEESYGNSMFQIIPENDYFKLKIRKENHISANPIGNYVQSKINFKYKIDDLRYAISSNKSVSVIVSRKEKGIYIRPVFEDHMCKTTHKKNGVIGLDFNKGFIQCVETDRDGNLLNVWQEKLDSHYKDERRSNKCLNDMREVMAKLVRYAVDVNKSIVCEDLDFRKKKANVLPAKGKNGKTYNRMISQLDYSRYHECMQNSCARLGVEIIRVNPAYTSKIGKQKYAKQKCLTVHSSAAYVIARRGQGFIDKYIPESKSKTIKTKKQESANYVSLAA